MQVFVRYTFHKYFLPAFALHFYFHSNVFLESKKFYFFLILVFKKIFKHFFLGHKSYLEIFLSLQVFTFKLCYVGLEQPEVYSWFCPSTEIIPL